MILSGARRAHADARPAIDSCLGTLSARIFMVGIEVISVDEDEVWRAINTAVDELRRIRRSLEAQEMLLRCDPSVHENASECLPLDIRNYMKEREAYLDVQFREGIPLDAPS